MQPEQERRRRSTHPQTRSELQAWVREHLQSQPPDAEAELLPAIDGGVLAPRAAVAAIQTRSHPGACRPASPTRWRASRPSCRQRTPPSAASRGTSRRSSQDLTDKTHRDPKTKLMNFSRFTEQLESFLALEQRGRWSAVGLVDITGFKWYNDALGHAVGDRIIERVANILREQARSDDVIAQERPEHAVARSARAVRRRRVLLPHSRYRRMLAGARHRRALPRSGGTLRLDARGRAARRAAGPRRRRRRLSLAGARRRSALRRADGSRRI